MTLATAPTFTDSVNQQFFIEALRGSKPPLTYLDSFPDAVYTKAIDSVLVTFLYALLGPTGVGQLHQEYLKARLEVEESGLSTTSLDSLYTNPFSFARLAEETYSVDADASLLTSQDRATILSQDASFRNRASDFFKGIRAGGTPLGLSLVAKSGLNRPVDIIENYRSLYDQYSDVKLNLKHYGSTGALNEIVVLPRQDVPQNVRQTITISGNPTSGWFTLSYPAGSDYQSIIVGMTNASPIITVPNSAQMSVGSWVHITSAPSSGPLSASPNPSVFAQVGAIIDGTHVSLIYPPGSGSAGSPYPMTSTATLWAYVANARTIRIPYNATFDVVQQALWALPLIGQGNVVARGGPLPSHPIDITFTNSLSGTAVPTLLCNTGIDAISGLGVVGVSTPKLPIMADVSGDSTTITATVTTDRVTSATDTQASSISPADQHAMEVALDRIRPVTSFVTVQSASSTTIRQQISNTFASDSLTQVIRYVTGSKFIMWPTIDGTHWIESGVEHEAPRPLGTDQHHYQAFHDITNVIAYTEAALDDPHYSNPVGGPVNPIWVRYYNTMVGRYSDAQISLMPVLANYQDDHMQFNPQYARAPSPDPLIITNAVNGISLINDKYPVDYLGLPGVTPLPTQSQFYASAERSSGTDYLEIDLGNVEAVNFIYLEATSKPYHIDVSYDVSDMTPIRDFVPASWVSATYAPSVTSLSYTSAQTNPWVPVTLNIVNSLGSMIYTRYIRLGFTRDPSTSAYAPAPDEIIPYGIEIRNLRIGRNVS